MAGIHAPFTEPSAKKRILFIEETVIVLIAQIGYENLTPLPKVSLRLLCRIVKLLRNRLRK